MTVSASLYIVGALAAFLTGMAKCGVPGLGILVVPLMAFAFPARESVGALLPILIAGDIVAITLFRRHAMWSWILRLAPWVAVGLALGAWWLKGLDDEALRRVLGGLVLSMVALDLVRRGMNWDRMASHPVYTGGIGILAGAATTLGNAAGPVMNLYLLGRKLPKELFVGTSAWFFFLVNLTKVPVFFTQSMLTRDLLVFDLCVIPFIGLGAWAGQTAMRRLPEQTFRRVVLGLTAIGGLRLLL